MSDSIIRPIPDRIEHLTSELRGPLKVDADGNVVVDPDTVTPAELASGLAGKADKQHGHVIADVGGLQAALDGKADVGITARERALLDLDFLEIWDNPDRPPGPDLGSTDSGHPWTVQEGGFEIYEQAGHRYIRVTALSDREQAIATLPYTSDRFDARICLTMGAWDKACGVIVAWLDKDNYAYVSAKGIGTLAIVQVIDGEPDQLASLGSIGLGQPGEHTRAVLRVRRSRDSQNAGQQVIAFWEARPDKVLSHSPLDPAIWQAPGFGIWADSVGSIPAGTPTRFRFSEIAVKRGTRN